MKVPTTDNLNLFRHQLTNYVSFTDTEWKIFAQDLGFESYKKKQHFLEAGVIGNYLGFILKGSVRYYYVKDGIELTGYFSLENEYIGAYKSFLTGSVARNNIQALEDTEVILVSRAHMDLMLANPIVALKTERWGRLIAEYLVVCYEDRTNSFVTETPEERYLKLIETQRNSSKSTTTFYCQLFRRHSGITFKDKKQNFKTQINFSYLL